MPFEYQIFFLLLAIAATAYIVHRLHQKRAENAEMVAWSNQAQPLIFEQPDATAAAQQATKILYETAVQKIKEHGNRWITEKDIHLWLWGADNYNTSPDFQQWALLNIRRRMDVFEQFRAEKAQRAARANDVPGMANVYTGMPEFDDINPPKK
jgi:hypothetical protein